MFAKTKSSFVAVALSACVVVQASPIVYLGSDDNVSSLADMVDSQSAAASFVAATGNLTTVNFETALPSNLIINGGGTTDDSGCGALCGINTTPGGGFVRLLLGGSLTFTFSTSVDAFGVYVTGLQTDLVAQQTIVFMDGTASTQLINVPSAINGGGAFVGVTDFSHFIKSVTFDATEDIVAFDDLLFRNARFGPVSDPLPEPGTLALVGLALAGLASARRRKQR
jgi:hypothetical protein